MDNKIKRESFFESLEMGFVGWFIVFMITTGLILLERYTGLEITNFYVRLMLYVISISLLCFWVGWILFGFGAVRKRKIIFFLVLVACLLKAVLPGEATGKHKQCFMRIMITAVIP